MNWEKFFLNIFYYFSVAERIEVGIFHNAKLTNRQYVSYVTASSTHVQAHAILLKHNCNLS